MGMTKEELEELYRAKIIPESKNPYHFDKVAGRQIKAYNPMCGDKYTLFIQPHEPLLSSIHFHGMGCALSKASGSILARKLEGKSTKAALDIIRILLEALEGGEIPEDDELKILSELKNFDGRVDCIRLCWDALKKELEA